MSRKPLKNVAHSVRQRLLNIAHERNEAAEWVYRAYGRERFLYRLAQSDYAERFVLKGATLFSIWTSEPYRTTRDVDLLGRGSNAILVLKRIFRKVCKTPVPDDGLRFDASSVQGEEIREEGQYQGVRVTLEAGLGQARVPVQIDVGFGDVVVPRPKKMDVPTLLARLPAPRLKAYPREAVVAEKFETMVRWGVANGRMNDFYDVWTMAQRFEFDGQTLSKSIKATFGGRKTEVPRNPPVALTVEFTENEQVGGRWSGFLRRDNVREHTLSLSKVVQLLRTFLMPPSEAVAGDEEFDSVWLPGGPWKRGKA